MATVLLIEDHPDYAAMLRPWLETQGHRFLWADTAEAGLETAAQEILDLILLDLGLPDLDGQVLLGRLRELPLQSAVPIVAITAWPSDKAMKMADAYGFDGYIDKLSGDIHDQIYHYLEAPAKPDPI